MKLSSIPAPVWQLASSVVGGLVVLYLVKHYGAKAAEAVNPLNHDNVFAASVNAAGAELTGKPFSLGSWIYDKTHSDEFEESERAHRERLANRG